MSDPPKSAKLFITDGARPPLAAVDDKGRNVLDLISHLDRRWPDGFATDRIRGYADEHALTLKLSEPSSVKSQESKFKSPESEVQRPGSKVQRPGSEVESRFAADWLDRLCLVER